MKNSLDKLHIALYGGGQFQGYLKSVSIYHTKVTSTQNKSEAKAYAKRETAMKDVELVHVLTHAGLTCEIV